MEPPETTEAQQEGDVHNEWKLTPDEEKTSGEFFSNMKLGMLFDAKFCSYKGFLDLPDHRLPVLIFGALIPQDDDTADVKVFGLIMTEQLFDEIDVEGQYRASEANHVE